MADTKKTLPLDGGGQGGGGSSFFRVGSLQMQRYNFGMSVERARELRRSPTEAEKRLWYHLRRRQVAGARFRRQVPLGPYIADFMCPSHRLIVEVDGGQHAQVEAYDSVRTRWLEANGFMVLRFWNNDVLGNSESVVEEIGQWLVAHPPSP